MKLLLVFGFVALCSSALIGSPLEDPQIPDGEIASYRIEQDKDRWTFVERTRSTIDNGAYVYRFEYEAPNELGTVMVSREAMLPYSVRSVTNGGDLTIETSTRIAFPSGSRYEQIMLLSFSELKYLLRGYPFDTPRDLDVAFFTTDSEEESGVDFSITVRYQGVETIDTGDRKLDAHRLELKLSASGIMRMMNALVPRTFFWYSVDSPYYLVAYEGSSSFPGSPKRFIRITDYSGW